MNFGKMNIHELDNDKNYIIELQLNKSVRVAVLYAYIKQVKDTLKSCGINNFVIIPAGSEMYIEKLTITENN